ncbi:MAG: glutamate--tRNA ligase [Clostridia bacterium]|nr:glutamate--tRNA ligase [Clostridia bacterium]
MMKVRTRFAPSPTGFMHLGGMRTALYCYLFAKQHGGDFILRIEDTDQERYVEGAVEVIYSSLKEGGMDYDEGPDKGGAYGPYVQTERKDIYLKYAKELVEKGGAYYCFCTKERVESLRDENGNVRYDKHCLKLSPEEVKKNLDAGVPYVIRQNIPEKGVGSYEDAVYGHIAVDYSELEDGVLIKSDGLPTYNFANVVDDHLMGITHVIRGAEYLSSTPKYNLMYDAFGWERPVYIHLPPIMKDATRKLSKRYGDANFDDFISKGYIAPAIVNYIALLGWCPKDNSEKMTMQEMIEKFSLDGVSKSPAIFDEVKLRWLNGEYLKAMGDEEFYKISEPFRKLSKTYGKYDGRLIAALLKPRIEIMSEIPEKIDFLEEYGEYDTEMFCHKKMKTDKELAKTVLPMVYDTLSSLSEFTHDSIHDALLGLAAEKQLKNGQVLWTARVALTGKDVTPGGAVEMAEILGKERSLERLEFSMKLLEK